MRTPIYRFAAFLFFLGAITAGFAEVAVPAEPDSRVQADGKGWRLDQAKITDPTRARVLLLGDSILNGYVMQVKAALERRAYVDVWINPYHQGTGELDRMVAEVLAHGPYDVIHFNMGLHGWHEGRIPQGRFEGLTRRLVENLRKGAPRAQLIWASSTPVTAKNQPGELDPLINPVIVEHNRMAERVMKHLGVPVNDLYGLLASKLNLARGDQFHWTTPAYGLLADAVVASVLRELPAK